MPERAGEPAARAGGVFDAVDVIRAKRDGGTLSDAQIDWVIDAYTRGAVAEEQMSALLMAVLLRGLSEAELTRWTAAMIASGERLDLSGVDRPTVDKHSTGGGRLVALACVDAEGGPLLPCGRCRQLLWEQGGPALLVDTADGPVPIGRLLPRAFGREDLDRVAGA